jgi:hypothetical protein
MATRKDENPEFYLDFSVDGEGRLQNMFWLDSQSQLDYGVFGDVVVFDSTYKVNKYNLPFVPFIGVPSICPLYWCWSSSHNSRVRLRYIIGRDRIVVYLVVECFSEGDAATEATFLDYRWRCGHGKSN